MSTWRKIGIAEIGTDSIDTEALRYLTESRSPEASAPLFLDPSASALDEFVSYLFNLESPKCGGPGYIRFRNVFLSSAWSYDTKNGNSVVVLEEPFERFAREKISEFMEEDRRELLFLGSELNHATQALSEDGATPTRASSVTASAAHAVAAMESFLAAPRRRSRFDLEDFFRSTDGVYALAGCIELLRRLLLAAGRAYDVLGAATIGHHDFASVDDAVSLWKVAEGAAAKRLTKALVRLMSRTPGLSGREEAVSFSPEPGDTTWIESSSRVGQEVLRWAYDRGGDAINIASAVGAAWPGPALYGYDDGKEDPSGACELCAALARRRDPEIPLLCGTHEAVLSQDLVVSIPERLLEGARCLYVTESAEEPEALFCQTPSRRFARLAQLITSEQELRGYPWNSIQGGETDFASDFEDEFSLRASGEEVAVVDGVLPLRGLGACEWARPGAPVMLLGAGDHFEIAEAERHTSHEEGLGIEPSELLDTYFQE